MLACSWWSGIYPQLKKEVGSKEFGSGSSISGTEVTEVVKKLATGKTPGHWILWDSTAIWPRHRGHLPRIGRLGWWSLNLKWGTTECFSTTSQLDICCSTNKTLQNQSIKLYV